MKRLAAVAVLGTVLIGIRHMNTNHIRLNGTIGEDADIETILETIQEASFLSTVVLHVNSPGGSVIIEQDIMRAIENRHARLVVEIDGLAMSAASVIPFMGDELIIEKNTEFLYHLASTGQGKMPANNPVNVMAVEDMLQYVGDYITVDEFKRMLEGQDVGILGSIMKDRLNHPIGQKAELQAMWDAFLTVAGNPGKGKFLYVNPEQKTKGKKPKKRRSLSA